MCELFFAYNTKGKLADESIIELLRFAKYNADRHNDGFGVFRDDGQIYKVPKQFRSKQFKRAFRFCKGAKFIVAHIRTKTQGEKCYKNTHPFALNKFVLAHNGNLTNLEHKTKTDSEMALRKIYHQKKARKTVTKIKRAFKDIEGWYSIFCYDKKDKDLYYFRTTAGFTFAYFPALNTIFGATDEDVLKAMFAELKMGVFWVRKYNRTIFEPEEDVIYKIGSNGLSIVGDIENSYVTSTYNHTYGLNRKVKDANYNNPLTKAEEGLWTQEDLTAYKDMWRGVGGG